jgi:hypothetical protein
MKYMKAMQQPRARNEIRYMQRRLIVMFRKWPSGAKAEDLRNR